MYDAVAGQLRLYVNGDLAATTAYSKPWNATGPVQLGAGWYGGPAPGSYFDGDIDDVRVFDRVVTGAEAAALATGTPGTLSDDDSQLGHHVTLRDNAYIDSLSQIGTGSLTLDGAGDHADTVGPVVATKGSFTVAGWVTGSPTQDAAVFSQVGTTNAGFTLRYSASAFGGNGGYQIEMHDNPATGAVRQTADHSGFAAYYQWDHVAIMYDAFRAEMKLYVNGQLEQIGELVSTGDNTVGFDATGPLQLGRPTPCRRQRRASAV